MAESRGLTIWSMPMALDQGDVRHLVYPGDGLFCAQLFSQETGEDVHLFVPSHRHHHIHVTDVLLLQELLIGGGRPWSTRSAVELGGDHLATLRIFFDELDVETPGFQFFSQGKADVA